MTAEQITEIADRFAITLDDERAEALSSEASAFRERLDVFHPSDPTDEAVKSETAFFCPLPHTLGRIVFSLRKF